MVANWQLKIQIKVLKPLSFRMDLRSVLRGEKIS